MKLKFSIIIHIYVYKTQNNNKMKREKLKLHNETLYSKLKFSIYCLTIYIIIE